MVGKNFFDKGLTNFPLMKRPFWFFNDKWSVLSIEGDNSQFPLNSKGLIVELII